MTDGWMKARSAGLLLAGALVAGGVTGCNANGDSTTGEGNNAVSGSTDCSAVKKGGSINMGISQDAVSFDAANTQDNGSIWVQMNIYDQLIELDPAGTKMVPGLASSWDVKNGGRLFVFHLRKDAKFSDGTPVTADDVKYSYDRTRSPKSIVNWTLSEIKTTRVVDPHTFQLTLAKPSAPFLSNLVLWGASIIPRGSAELASSKTHPVSSGPFYVADWKPGQSIELKRNKYFWGKDKCGNQYPYLDSISLDYLPDDNARITELRGGQIDATTLVPFNQVKTLDQAPQISARATPQLGSVNIALNQTVPGFTDVHVTQAMNYAIDRDSLVKGVFFGNAQPGKAVIDPGVLYSTKEFAHTYDLSKAKSLMQSADPQYRNGFTVSFSYPAGDTTAKGIVSVLQSDLAKIGIKIQPNAVDFSTLQSQWNARKFDMMYSYLTQDNLDPNANALFCCVSWGGAKSNYTGWVNAKADALFAKTLTTLDDTERQKLYVEWQKLIMEQAPILPLVNPYNTFAYNDDVHGFSMQSTGHYPLWPIWKG